MILSDTRSIIGEAMRSEQQERILDAAERLFLQNGVSATGIKDICDALDISKGTLYYHYKSKNDIVYDLSMRYIDRSDAMLDKFFESAGDKPFEQMLYECLNTVRLKKTSEKLHYILMAYGVTAYPALKQVIVRRYESWISKIIRILGIYRPGSEDNLIVAHVIMSIFDGFALRNMLDMPNIFEDQDTALEFIRSFDLVDTYNRGNGAGRK